MKLSNKKNYDVSQAVEKLRPQAGITFWLDDDELRGAEIDFTEEELDAAGQALIEQEKVEFESKLIKAIKSEAGKRINDYMPDYKQRNALADIISIVNESVEARDEGRPYTQSPEDRAKMVRLKADKTFIETIRAKSDQLEIDVQAMTHEQRLAFNVEDDANWI